MRLARKVVTFARQPLFRKRLAAEAAASIVLARLMVWRRGQFGALLAHGELRQATTGEPEQVEDVQMVREIAWSVAAVAPWTRRRTPCLVEALAAARMLSRRSVDWTLNVGLGRGPNADRIIAHAWLIAGGRVVTGRRGLRSVTPMASYRRK